MIGVGGSNARSSLVYSNKDGYDPVLARIFIGHEPGVQHVAVTADLTTTRHTINLSVKAENIDQIELNGSP